jgi:hypothetical protein
MIYQRGFFLSSFLSLELILAWTHSTGTGGDRPARGTPFRLRTTLGGNDNTIMESRSSLLREPKKQNSREQLSTSCKDRCWSTATRSCSESCLGQYVPNRSPVDDRVDQPLIAL